MKFSSAISAAILLAPALTVPTALSDLSVVSLQGHDSVNLKERTPMPVGSGGGGRTTSGGGSRGNRHGQGNDNPQSSKSKSKGKKKNQDMTEEDLEEEFDKVKAKAKALDYDSEEAEQVASQEGRNVDESVKLTHRPKPGESGVYNDPQGPITINQGSNRIPRTAEHLAYRKSRDPEEDATFEYVLDKLQKAGHRTEAFEGTGPSDSVSVRDEKFMAALERVISDDPKLQAKLKKDKDFAEKMYNRYATVARLPVHEQKYEGAEMKYAKMVAEANPGKEIKLRNTDPKGTYDNKKIYVEKPFPGEKPGPQPINKEEEGDDDDREMQRRMFKRAATHSTHNSTISHNSTASHNGTGLYTIAKINTAVRQFDAVRAHAVVKVWPIIMEIVANSTVAWDYEVALAVYGITMPDFLIDGPFRDGYTTLKVQPSNASHPTDADGFPTLGKDTTASDILAGLDQYMVRRYAKYYTKAEQALNKTNILRDLTNYQSYLASVPANLVTPSMKEESAMPWELSFLINGTRYYEYFPGINTTSWA